MPGITVTELQLAAAFTEWERRYREEPNRFMSEAQKILTETPMTYGEACAPYFIEIMRDLGFAPVTVVITAQQPEPGVFAALTEMISKAVKAFDGAIRPRGEPKYATGGLLDVPPAVPGDRPGEVSIKPKRARKPRVIPNTTKNSADEL